MSRYVLDASVVLALVHRESGHEQMAEFLWEGAISSVNLSEVVAKLSDRGLDEGLIRDDLQKLALDVIPFDEAMAFGAARIRALSRPFGLALGDRACLATAQSLRVPAVTADGAWAGLSLGIEIRVLR